MFRNILVLILFISYIKFHLCWDVAISTNEEIELLSRNGDLNVTVAAQLHGIRDITYDNYNGYIYLSDTSHDKYSIFRVYAPSDTDNPSTKLEPLVLKEEGHFIQGLAYDPVDSVLFWTTAGSSRSVSFAQMPTDDVLPSPQKGSILHSFTNDVPHGIVLDICRRYIFWTNINDNQPSIHRSDINGSHKLRLIDKNLNRPYAITIDIVHQYIYWTDYREVDVFYIERSNLNGENRQIIFQSRSLETTSISIGFDHLYFIHNAEVWSLDLMEESNKQIKLFNKYVQPKAMFVLTSDKNYVFNSTIEKSECVLKVQPIVMKSVPQVNSSQITILPNGSKVIIETISGEDDQRSNRSCSGNGILIKNSTCFCKEGFHGESCQLHLACINYCMNGGSCEVDVTGVATCTSCPIHYTGHRCEIDICEGKCLNGGTCHPVDINQTHCSCSEGYFGQHCEHSEIMCKAYCLLRNDVDTFPSQGPPSFCRCDKYKDSIEESVDQVNKDLENGTETLFSSSHEDGAWGPFNIVTLLGSLCTMLAGLVCFLFVKIRKLSKRPRVQKRIIVNKTTPLTSRPLQDHHCEITIENCCDMNICDTPCFEPEFRTPIVKSNRKTEDKKSLLDNMEDPQSGGEFHSS